MPSAKDTVVHSSPPAKLEQRMKHVHKSQPNSSNLHVAGRPKHSAYLADLFYPENLSAIDYKIKNETVLL